MHAWMRVIKIVFTSKSLKKRLVFGTSELGNELNITCTGYKYMSALKDTFTIKIDNLTYNEITQLVMGQFYDVEIWAGYQNGNINKVFEGGVLYITNKPNTNKTNTAIILCASSLVAKYGQNRINLTLNSGINLYSAIEFICRRAGIPNSNVSTQFKKEFVNEITTVNDNVGNWLDKLASNNNAYITNADGIASSVVSIFDAAKSNARIIKLKNSDISLTESYPRLTSEGLELTLLPTFNFMCGDIIEIDNSIIDISVSNREEMMENYASYFSQKGQYMIYEMAYVLQNRGSTFSLRLKCKNRDRITSYVGGDNG